MSRSELNLSIVLEGQQFLLPSRHYLNTSSKKDTAEIVLLYELQYVHHTVIEQTEVQLYSSSSASSVALSTVSPNDNDFGMAPS